MQKYRALSILFSLSLAFLSATVLRAQECNLKNTSFQAGEKVSYHIYYNLGAIWVNAGEVYFKVDTATIAKKPYYHFDSYGRSHKKYDWIYKVRDHYQTWSDTSNLHPIRFKRSVKEGSTELEEDYVFYHQRNEVVTLRKVGKKASFVKDTVPFSSCSFDVLSMIYYARNVDFSNAKPNDTIPIRIFIDNEEHDSYLRFLGREELKVKDLGTFRCIKFKPLLIEGSIFNAGEDMTVWVTDDANRVPVLINTPILVGSIKARATKMEGLRHPITSEIEDK